jgi:hypothetical protein
VVIFAVLVVEGFFEFDTRLMVWSELSGKVRGQQPTARIGCSLTTAGGKLFLFGGQSSLTGEFQNVYKDVSLVNINPLVFFKNTSTTCISLMLQHFCGQT